MAWSYSDKYAAEQLEFDATTIKACFDRLISDYGAYMLNKLEKLNLSGDKLKQFAAENENIFTVQDYGEKDATEC